MTKVSYYDITCNDLLFLKSIEHSTFYNQIAVQAQQVSEKALKSVLELVSPDADKLLNGHNLRAIYTEIKECEPSFQLKESDLSYLKDFYFDARYPGENYISVTEEQCMECLQIMYQVVDEVNLFRQKHQLPLSESDISLPR